MRLALLVLIACLAVPSTAGAALQAQYHLDVRSANSDSGSFTDDSGPNGLTLRGPENSTILDTGGKFSNHLAEGNVNPSIVDEGNAAPLDAQRVTLLAWVRKQDGLPAAGQVIAGRGLEEATCGTHSYVLETAAGGTARFSIQQMGGKVSSPVSSAAFDGNWHLLTGTFDGKRVRLYVDGKQAGFGTATSSDAISYNDESGFGIDGYAGGFALDCPGQDFTGGIDELRVYNQALSPSEIGRLASATGPNPPALVPDTPVPGAGGGGTFGSAAPSFRGFRAPAFVPSNGLLRVSVLSPRNVQEYHYDLNSDGRTDATCPGHAPTIETRPTRSGTTRIEVTALNAVGQVRAVTTTHVVSKKKYRALVPKKKTSLPHICIQDTAAFPNHAYTKPSEAGGSSGPPPGCGSTITFDYIEAVGCFDRVRSIKDIPILEYPVLDELIRDWNSTPALREVFGTRCKEEMARGLRPKGSCPKTEVIDRSQIKKILGETDFHVSRKTVRMNGLDFEPLPGAAIVLAPEINRVVSSAAIVTVGNIPIKAGPINLDVESGHLPGLKRIRNGVALGNFKADASKLLGGFKLTGELDITMGRNLTLVNRNKPAPPKKSYIKARLEIPTQLTAGDNKPATLGVDLETSNQRGLELDTIKAAVPQLFLGPVELRDMYFNYFNGPPKVWEAGGNINVAGLKLGFAPPPDINGIKFVDGRINKAGARITFPTTSRPKPFPGVFIDRIGFGMYFDPLVFRGDILVSALERTRIDGVVLVAFATPGEPYTVTPGDTGGGGEEYKNHKGNVGAGLAPLAGRTFKGFTIAAGGTVFMTLPVLNTQTPLASGYFVYSSPSYIGFGGRMSYSATAYSVKGQVDGAFNGKKFNLEGKIEFCVYGIVCPFAEGVVSSAGMAACAGGTVKVPIIDEEINVKVGAGYSWRDGLTVYLIGCDIAPYRAQVARVSQSGARTVTIRKGLPNAMIRIDGPKGSAPRVKVTAPNGQSVSTRDRGFSASPSKSLIALRGDPDGRTYVGVKNPPAGRYKIEPLPGSGPITRVLTANGLPPARIRAKVRGKGRTRRLTYSVLRREGQRVTFEQRAGTTSRIIGSTTGGKGSIRFKPSTGPGGTRKIVARVELGGIPNKNLTVARFRVPDTLTPTRVRGLRVKRTRKALLVRFRKARNSRRYRIVLSKRNGDKRAITTRRRSLRVRLATTDSGRVRVMGVGPTGITGKPAAKRFKFRVKPVTKFQKYKRGKGKIKRKRRR